MHNSDKGPSTGSMLLARKLITVLFLLQLLAGIILLTCGTMSLKMTAGQTGGYGPPYFIGTFLVGSLMILSGGMWGAVYSCRHHLFRKKRVPNTIIYTPIIINHVFAYLAILSGIIGIAICAKYGLNRCSTYQTQLPVHTCNYTVNMRENHSLVVLELAFMAAATLLSLFVGFVSAWLLYILRVQYCCRHACCCCNDRTNSVCCFRNSQSQAVHRTGVPATSQELKTFDVNENNS